ncbi:UNVERIFIED_CONTAM: hypothetical protein NCL1_09147 [Trichonephila clavipes]
MRITVSRAAGWRPHCGGRQDDRQDCRPDRVARCRSCADRRARRWLYRPCQRPHFGGAARCGGGLRALYRTAGARGSAATLRFSDHAGKGMASPADHRAGGGCQGCHGDSGHAGGRGHGAGDYPGRCARHSGSARHRAKDRTACCAGAEIQGPGDHGAGQQPDGRGRGDGRRGCAGACCQGKARPQRTGPACGCPCGL